MSRSSYDPRWFVEIAYKWSRIWEEKRVFEANPDPSKPKFFVTAAFMYPNSPIHMGHARTYLIPDIIARFKRLQGYNVLFPMGFHYTGTPIITMSEAIAEGDTGLIELFRDVYGVPPDVIDKMRDPLYLARYFHSVSKEAMKLYGLSIDWRREFVTIDPEFVSFIHWQFRKLYEKGYIVRGTHPVGWCPKHQMPVGMHDTKGDVEPEIGEFVAILFRDENGVAYPTATLRPETIFGVTNLWVNPDEEYVLIELENGDRWIVGKKASERLKYQIEFKVLNTIKGSDLVGRYVCNPITGETVPILPASFVDASFATGVVMSVPAHAPYDAAALEDLRNVNEAAKNITPRIIIEIENRPRALAYEALKRYGISSQADRDKLDEATKWVYSTELSSGRMVRNLVEIVPARDANARNLIEKVSGRPVAEAREMTKKFILEKKLGVIVYELLNKPVYCRCGTEVVVKVLKDQWFIDYGNEEWKKLAYEALESMKIVPEESRAQFRDVIAWLKRRACARTRGLGVPLPWDPSWIIESLSDSTIYMAFYTVIHRIRAAGIDPKKLDDEFWDYVMLGKGSAEEVAKKLGVDPHIVEEIRKEFDYWYPLDWRVSGKDLIPNHLSFFIFNHVAIFPREKWPRGIIANGWVLIRQRKMSKSARNIIPLKRVIEEYGPDVVRLALALGAEVHQDLNFDPDTLQDYGRFLSELYNEILSLAKMCENLRKEMNVYDKWFRSAFIDGVLRVLRAVDEVRLREAAIIVFYELRNIVKRYLQLVDRPHEVLRDFIKIWIALIQPFTPFIAEELWSHVVGEGLVSTYVLPKIDESMIDRKVLFSMKYADLIVEYIKDITRATKKERLTRVIIYVAPRDLQNLAKIVAELRGKKFNEILSEVTKRLSLDKKAVAPTLKKVYDVIVSIPEDIVSSYTDVDDEFEILSEIRGYLEKTLGTKIELYRADDDRAPDYGGKKRVALPLRPGIYVE